MSLISYVAVPPAGKSCLGPSAVLFPRIDDLFWHCYSALQLQRLIGTSLIAIMLGRLRMDVDDCIDAYQELGPRIFQKRKTLDLISATGRLRALYSHEALTTVAKEIIMRRGFKEEALLQADQDTALPVTYGLVYTFQFCDC